MMYDLRKINLGSLKCKTTLFTMPLRCQKSQLQPLLPLNFVNDP